MKKKVCIIHKVSQLDPRSFYKQGSSLVRAGYDATLISFCREAGEIDGVRLVSFGYPKSRIVRLVLTNIVIFLRALREKADIYHFHDLDFVPWAMLLKILSRKKVIYDVHEAYPEYMLIKPYIPKYLRKAVSRAVHILEQTGALFFDAIITNDNFVLDHFRHNLKEVVYNFPLLDFFHDGSALPYEERPYDIIFLGSLPAWHFKPMLDTAEILRDRGFHVKWLVLPSKDAPRQWMAGEIRKRNLTEAFSIRETVPFLSVPRYVYSSRIGIITIPPYRKYLKNIPLKIFEYMGCGLPVIASDLPPSRQFVGGEDCALLVPHEPSAYADAIISLIRDPQKALEMGRRGKKLVSERFNWGSEERKMADLYARLFDQAKSR